MCDLHGFFVQYLYKVVSKEGNIYKKVFAELILVKNRIH